jgi:hypothetical protein
MAKAGLKQRALGAGVLSFITATVVLSFQNCSTPFGLNDEMLKAQTAEMLSESLATSYDRIAELETILRGLVDQERKERIAGDEKLAADLAALRAEVEQEIQTLKLRSSNLEKDLAALNRNFQESTSELNKRIDTVNQRVSSVESGLNEKMKMLDSSLRDELKKNTEMLNGQIEAARKALQKDLMDRVGQLTETDKALAKQILGVQSEVMQLAAEHEALKRLLTTQYATKEEVAQVKRLYDSLKKITDSLDMKIKLTKEEIERRLDKELLDLNGRLGQIEWKQEYLQRRVEQNEADLKNAIASYRADIKELSTQFQTKLDQRTEQIMFMVSARDDEMRAEFEQELESQALKFCLFVKVAVSELSERIQGLEAQIKQVADTDKARADQLAANLRQLREQMSLALAEEQAARRALNDRVNALASRLAMVEADLAAQVRFAQAQAEIVRKLGSDFKTEQAAVAARFDQLGRQQMVQLEQLRALERRLVEQGQQLTAAQAAQKRELEAAIERLRAETDSKLATLKQDLENKIKKVAEDAAKAVAALGADVQSQMRKITTDIAVLNTRVNNIDKTLRSLVEEFQADRGLNDDFELKITVQRRAAINALVSIMRGLRDVQLTFVRTLAPEEGKSTFYDESFKPIQTLCKGNTGTAFPNALGFDSFQLLAMEYNRALLLGDRPGVPSTDSIFHDYAGALNQESFGRELLVALIKFPGGTEDGACVDEIRKWSRSVLLVDPRFQAVRNALSQNSELSRDIGVLMGHINNGLRAPADAISQLLRDALNGAQDLDAKHAAIRFKIANELISTAFAEIMLQERNQVFNQIALAAEDSKDNGLVRAEIAAVKTQLDEFKRQTNERIAAMQSQLDGVTESMRRALDVLLTIVDRAGYDDLRSYVVYAGQPIQYTPRVISNFTPRITMIQHFFDSRYANFAAGDACTGATIMMNGGIQTFYQHGHWGRCWINFRALPQPQWANEAGTAWFRVFGSAHAINLRVIAEKQRERRDLFQQFYGNFDRTIDYRTAQPNQSMNGSFSCGVFDFKGNDLLQNYVQNIRTWTGMVVTFTPRKIDTVGTGTVVTNGNSVDYSLQLFSPLVLDFHTKGQPRVLSLAESQAEFDLDSDGRRDRVAWVTGDQGAFLALDLNKNGRVDSGRELFGEGTVLKSTGRKAVNGFEALAQYDSNRDGVINSKDSVFGNLVVWRDHNGDGRTQKTEVERLSQAGVTEISLSYSKMPVEKAAQVDADLRYVASFKGPKACGEQGCKIYDIFFGMKMKPLLAQAK